MTPGVPKTQQPLPTVFLDRDGVINRRIVGDYVTSWSEFEPLQHTYESIVRLNRGGYRTVVVTNQRGVALGRMSLKRVTEIHRVLSQAISDLGGTLTEFYVCPHDRDTGCPCRKPEPGLLDQAHSHLAVDWSASFLVGDSDTDIMAGLRRGLTTIKVDHPSEVGAHYHCRDLAAATDLILARGIKN